MMMFISKQDGKGNVDMSFFAPDCFHMSVKGHRAIAAALWSNMVHLYLQKAAYTLYLRT